MPTAPSIASNVRPPQTQGALFDASLLSRAFKDSFIKMNPRRLAKNPVMFCVGVGSLVTTILLVRNLSAGVKASELAFQIQIVLWLWFTVIFANFAEAMAEGRGKAHADSLRQKRKDVTARRILANGSEETVPAASLRMGDVVVVSANETIPSDGEVIEGAATVNESAITGESAPVIRESGGDRSGVTGGTVVLSDTIKIRITVNPGSTFMDRMIGLVEGAHRQKAPNEIALDILLSCLSIIFLVAVATLLPFAIYSVNQGHTGQAPSQFQLVALLVCLIPTTIGGLLSAIGIAGMDRVLQHNVLAMSGKAVEAAGDIDTLLLDKTGTITLGNREAAEFIPAPGISVLELADAAQLSSLADETPEGRSIVVLAKQFGIRERQLSAANAEFIAFSAHTRMSGVNIDGKELRKGAADAIERYLADNNANPIPEQTQTDVTRISSKGGTPLVVADNRRGALGVIYLKDIVKGGMRERFEQLRKMGIHTIMITGDNPMTAAVIAGEAGVDEFVAQATPETKMRLIEREQAGGRLVAMTGDGTNDAPALAAADVGVAMNTGTQEAKEAGNMIDLDSNPTKLVEIVAIGKQLLMTRGALTSFSVANDVAKYFAILPAMFVSLYAHSGSHGPLSALNIMSLHSPESAILSAVIFNAIIIIALVPLALKGVTYKPMDAAALLRRNLLIYGVGGVIAPFPSIWAIDWLLVLTHLAPAS